MRAFGHDSSLTGEIEALCIEKLSIRVQSTDQDLLETGLLDSLSLVQLVLELERHFQIELPMGELDITSLKSVSEMARLVAQRKEALRPIPPEVLNQIVN